MSTLFTYLKCGSAGLGFLVLSAGARPPEPAMTCQQRVAHTYDLLAQAQRKQQGKVVVIHYAAETVFTAPGQKKAQKSVSRFVLITRREHTYLSNGEVDIYRDDQTQVCVIHQQRTILITNTGKQPATTMAPWIKMRDQLLTEVHVSACEMVHNGQSTQRRIVTVPNPKGTLRGKLTSVEYRLDEHTDALQKMTMYYPAGQKIISSALVFGTQEVKSLDPTVDAPALSHVLGPNRKLLPAYRSFNLQDQRQK